MSQLTLQTHVADIVTAVPQSADLFRALRIDFCCGGKIPLEEAAITRKLDSSAVLDQIRTLETKGGVSGQPAWRSGGTGADRIHSEQASRFLREELPALTPYMTKLARVHGERHPELLRVQKLFADLKSELQEHTEDEDHNVFPQILKSMANPNPQHLEELRPLLSGLEEEHEQAGNLLKELREVTGDFALPADACGTYRLVYQRLGLLEKDTFEHIHLENNVLFERIRERCS